MNKIKEKLANALNVMYKDVVNKKIVAQVDTKEYVEAKEFVEGYYPKLNTGVMEYLAMYMCVQPDGTIQFFPSEKSTVELLCTYADKMRLIGYADNGVIVKDQITEKTSGQKGE